jgi:hypothetical protein
MVNPASAPDETCTLSNPIDLEEDLDSRRRCAIALETAAELLINVPSLGIRSLYQPAFG